MIGGILDSGSENPSPEIALWLCASPSSSGSEHRNTYYGAGLRITDSVRTQLVRPGSVNQGPSVVSQDVFIVPFLYQILRGHRAGYLDLWGITPALKKALSREKFKFCTPHPVFTAHIRVAGNAPHDVTPQTDHVLQLMGLNILTPSFLVPSHNL